MVAKVLLLLVHEKCVEKCPLRVMSQHHSGDEVGPLCAKRRPPNPSLPLCYRVFSRSGLCGNRAAKLFASCQADCVTLGRDQQQVTFRDLLHHLQTERKALLAKKSLSYLPS